jgi:pyruvate kinase
MRHAVPFKRSKILATIGPSVDGYDKIVAIIRSGVNGIRFNFSHSTYENCLRQMAWVRKASKEVGKPVAIIQDLQGPRIRLGDFEGTVTLKAGEEWKLIYGEADINNKELPLKYDLSKKVKKDERLFIADGRIRTKITNVSPKVITLKVSSGGPLTQRKGLNMPDTDFGGDILTKKDLEDIEFGLGQDFDYVAVSFVQTAKDVERLRTILKKHGSECKIVTKVETQVAIRDENLEEIVKASDAVMVARGDLAIETSPEIVPIVQQHILSLTQKHNKISIVATQMLASMQFSPQPTRAEVSDIATAVMSGTDCVMLSDETACGQFPLEAVETMRRVILYTQDHMPFKPVVYDTRDSCSSCLQSAISAAAVELAHEISAQAIVCETKTGATAIRIAAKRPDLPIISVTSSNRVAQQLCLLYATKSFVRPNGEYAGLSLAKELCKEGTLVEGRPIVLVSGGQPGLEGGTDTIRIRTL